MLRTVLLLFSGAALGAAVLHFVRVDPALPDTGRVSLSSATSGDGVQPARGENLEAAVLELGAEPASGERTLRVAAALFRLAERDPGAAVRLSRSVRAEAELTRLLFLAWVEADFDAAMAELGAAFAPHEARELAVALLRSSGNDESRVARLVQFLPPEERSFFLADAVAARGETAPTAALRQALAIEDAAARNLALTRLAQTWGRQDPRQALASLTEIRDEQERAAFRGGVIGQWTQSEPAAALEYALDLEPAALQPLVLGMLHRVPTADLGRVLTAAARLDGQTGAMVRQTVLHRLAQEDPAAALGHIALLPAHEQRQFRTAIAHPFGAKDPEAAFAWAQSLQPRDPQVVAAVLNGIAQTSPDRAFDLALSLRAPGEREQALAMVTASGFRGGEEAEKMLNRVLAIDDDTVRQRALPGLLVNWSSTDPERALAWLEANQHHVPADAFQHVAAQLAFRDPALAASYTDRIPQAARRGWLATVASAYAQQDPDAALAWLAQYRGDPAYEDALRPVAAAIARSDGAAAVRLLESSGALTTPQSVMNVAVSWAQQDPSAAAGWASRLEDPRMRVAALQLSLQQWSANDPEGARSWALGLPPGDARDDALSGLATSPFLANAVDEELLAAIGSEFARNRAVAQISMRLAASGQYDQARALLEQRMTDPIERGRALDAIAQMRAGRIGAPGMGVNPALGVPPVRIGTQIGTLQGGFFSPPPAPPPRPPPR